MVQADVFHNLSRQLSETSTTLIAVSKLKTVDDIRALYSLGQRDFAENYVQELVEKQPQLPSDIRWHFIGHLQSNKVKYIAPFVYMIHAVDSFRLLSEINKQAAKLNRTIACLLQLHVAAEDTKYGLDEKEVLELLEYYSAQKNVFRNVRIEGMMGMASFTENENQVRAEFRQLRTLFGLVRQSYFLGDEYFWVLSMGMSGDYAIAVQEGSTHVRIGSLLFGKR